MTQRTLNQVKARVRDELHPTLSYYGLVRAHYGRLIGGGDCHQSSRFTTRKQAQRWVDVAVAVNRNVRTIDADDIYGKVCDSQHPPEIGADDMVIYTHVAPSIVG